MALKPWYKVVDPREDLRENRPLDASEFAVHLDQVRDGRAPDVYKTPEHFFERTYLTQNLTALATEVIRRLSGIKVETSAVFNLTTQFGGGKTHSLTLLYHLARGAVNARRWKGVASLLERAKVDQVPQAETGIFVGSEFDSLSGRGGDDGTPIRRTPWGELAWQLGRAEAFAVVEEHERTLTAPGGDVISKMLPTDRPVLILMDELMNYVSRYRKSGLATQLYNFLQNLSEVARGRDNTVLAVSIPASEFEMGPEDQADHERFKKLLDRVGKAVFMSAEAETSEIIRRRLFEWSGMPPEGAKVVTEYANWVLEHRHLLPSWFPVEHARETFAATYPFHPSVISVFERKWQVLPRFQQTRGMLRLLALWVSRAHADGYKGLYNDWLITLGTAPLDDPEFRAAMFEQLGEQKLEAAVTTDIAGKDHAHADRLDKEATAEVKKARLHRKIATSIFFESNGGQQRGEATLGEIRLAVASPDLDIGNVEQCLDALVETCYYLVPDKNRYRFSFLPNLNKLLADRRASVPAQSIRDRVRAEITKVFGPGRVPFPEKSADIPDRPALTVIILAPELAAREASTKARIESFTREYGASSRTYKSALIWCVAEDSAALNDEARKLLAWEEIENDAPVLRLDEVQQSHLAESLRGAKRDLREAVWRSYKNVFLLDESNEIRRIDLGLVHSSAADEKAGLVGLILFRLQEQDIVSEGVSPNFLVRNWPPALPEWSTKSARDAFFASPKFPRLLNPDVVRRTISRGVEAGVLAYMGKKPDGSYEPFHFKAALSELEVEIADDMYILRGQDAEAYLSSKATVTAGQPGWTVTVPEPGQPQPPTGGGGAQPGGKDGTTTPPPIGLPTSETVPGFRWQGEIDPYKWMNFYQRILAPYAISGGLKVKLEVEVQPPGGVSVQKIQEAKVALRELGMQEEVARIEEE